MPSNLGAIFIKWFYWDAPRSILSLIRHFLAWVWQMFSIGYFFPRIFSPWHRDITGYGHGFDLSVWTQAFMSNAISRLVGAFLRVFFIVSGLILELVILAGGAVVFALWLAMPAIIIYLFITGAARL
jgi:hypothetical protein